MAVNLLELAQSAIGKQVIGQLGGLLGESEERTQSALKIAGPALLGGLMKKASTPAGANDVFRSLDDVDDGILDNLGGLLSGGEQSQGLMELGGKLLAMLFGSEQDSMVATIARLAGLGQGSTKSLLGALAPIVMGLLSRQRKSAGLDVGGMTNLLMGQKQYLSGALPGDLGSQLGIGDLLAGGADAARDAGQAVAESTRDAGCAVGETGQACCGIFKSLLPLIIVLALGLLAWRLFSGGADQVPDATVPGVDVDAISSQLTSSLGGLTDSIAGITDEVSAREMLPQIAVATKAVDGLGIDGLAGPAKSTVGGVLLPLLRKIEAALETVYTIPGVRAIVGPVIDPLLSKLEAIAGTDTAR